jgi:phospholipid/cholesterol/gamma-HCH transport system substrate-binding protein
MLLLGALFIFGLATFYVENWQFYLGKGYRLTARFSTAHTLDKGDTVRMAGVAVGIVEDLNIETQVATDKPVEAVLWIRRGLRVRADDVATIRISSVFGGNYIAIERGDLMARELRNGDEIPRTAVEASISEVIEQSKKTLADIDKAVGDIGTVGTQLTEGKGTLGKLLMDEALANKLEKAVDQASTAMDGIKTAADRLEKGQGVLGKLLMDDELANKVVNLADDAGKVAANLTDVSEDLAEGKGTIGRLLKDESLYTELKDSVNAIADVAKRAKEGQGLLPRLLDDKQMADDARQVFADLRDIADKMTKGESTAGKLLASDEAYKELMASLDNLKQASSAISSGEGTLGKFIKDDKVYQQLTELLTSVQGIVDTYREQSPVISFAGAVFGAF